ncbi:MAG: hypothetical protein LBC88_07580 [Spirochaetaceae bacterium]|jgi:hypothetical protein|nr:hypothetical protein [Spirochaetaceae bacterium]
MSITSYLEAQPLNEPVRYAAGMDAVPIAGFPRQHPSDTAKLLLIHDPLGSNPQVMEFRKEDVSRVEDIHAAITEAGEGVRLVKLWVRRGAIGVLMKPFEVTENLSF